MNKMTFTLLCFFCSLTLVAQDKNYEVKVLTESQQYNKVIEQFASAPDDLSARALYYIGYAYFMKEDDSNCIKFMDLSITKDAKDPAPHYIKGATLNYIERYQEAVQSFQTAISLKGDNADYYSSLGDAYYYSKQRQPALAAYTKATQQTRVPDRAYSMIAQIYSELKENKKAIEAYYTAKAKIPQSSEAYLNALFNIGTLESLEGHYDKAEPAFLELLQLAPTDYHTYSKLIQIYTHQKAYDKVTSYKDKLYEAHKAGLLPENLKDKFCLSSSNGTINAFMLLNAMKMARKTRSITSISSTLLTKTTKWSFAFKPNTHPFL